MQLEFEAQGSKDEQGAARKAAEAFSGISLSQIISWRKRAQAKEPRDPALKMAVKQCLEFWKNQHRDPGQAAAALKKILRSKKSWRSAPGSIQVNSKP
jgi:hypothetical protein